jgi:hypothetical protein
LIENHNIGAAATGTANASDANIYGVGFYGSAWTNSATRCTGVVGEGHVTATGDTGTATGLRGYAHDTHAGGSNVGLYGSAQNGATNYALYLHTGNIYTNAEAKTWDINGDITFDEFTYGFKGLTLANYNERIDARGTLTSGTLTLATTTGNVITATQNGSITIAMPSTFTSVGARKIQLDLTYTAGTLTLPTPSSSFKWVGGSAPTISTTSGKINRFLFATNDGTNWTANYVGAY